MMRYSHKVILLVACVLALQVNLKAQIAPGKGMKYTFNSYNSLQLVNGKSSVSAAVHSVNGFQTGKLFAGIGTGFDYYYHTSVPLFLEARYNLFGTGRVLQGFVNGGIHIPFGNTNKREPWKTGDFKAGRLLAAGIDYYVPLKKDAVIIGVAYSQKRITQMVNSVVWNPELNRTENVPVKEDYEFNRIWLKIGWVF